VIPKFQIEKLRNKNYEPFDIIYEIPHSLFSVFWIDEEKIKEILNDEKIIKFIISAVAYHHWRESFDDYIRTNEDFKKFAKKVLDEWKDKFEEKLRNEFGNLNINDTDIFELIKNIALNEKRLKKILNNFSFYRIAIPPYKFDYQILRETLSQSFEDQKKWILISGFLQRCDHFASFCEEEGESLDKIEINQPDFKRR
ncbi:MAG: CRISPR-associated endonuclease Cas3'', partial [candidate division WOR-3 bacterium]